MLPPIRSSISGVMIGPSARRVTVMSADSAPYEKLASAKCEIQSPMNNLGVFICLIPYRCLLAVAQEENSSVRTSTPFSAKRA